MDKHFGETRVDKIRLKWRSRPALLQFLFAILTVLAAGCLPPDMGAKRPRYEPLPDTESGNPYARPLPGHLKSVSGVWNGTKDHPEPFSIRLPDAGWYMNTGLLVPGARVVFVRGDRDPADAVLAVAITEKPTPAELRLSDDPAALKKNLVKRAEKYFNIGQRKFSWSAIESCPGQQPRCVLVSGDLEYAGPPPPLAYDTALMAAFHNPGGGSIDVTIAFPDKFRQPLQDEFQSMIDSLIVK